METSIRMSKFAVAVGYGIGLQRHQSMGDDGQGNRLTIDRGGNLRNCILSAIAEFGFARMTGGTWVASDRGVDPGHDVLLDGSRIDVKAVEKASHRLVVNRWACKGNADKFVLCLVQEHADGEATVTIRGWLWSDVVFGKPAALLPGRQVGDECHAFTVSELEAPETLVG